MSSTTGLKSGSLLNELARQKQAPKYGPPCECHGLPMYWHKMNDRSSGGLWRCTERHRELSRRTAAQKRKRDRAAAKKEKRMEELRVKNRLESLERSRDMWRQRALAAEWGLKQARPKHVQIRSICRELDHPEPAQIFGKHAPEDRTVAA